MSSFAELEKESSFYNVAIVDRRRDVFVVTNTFYKLQVCRDELLEETNYKLTLPFARHLFGCGKTVRGCNERAAFEGASSVFVCWSSIGKTKNDLFPCSFFNKYLVERLFRFCRPCF
ncbi:hypothetical protein GAYE_SCF06G2817 [Galdieria yellowstonensis]|uniref:Uncharacterized protein n=1 Tax=Galdieria yellowstonensis TaxID=3028027 RepID=A0AAV9IBY7_9RHOD|nr:hypothetical protein GAYE_SCF06G2817 [Galdieria yellowstonensis]